MSKVWQPPLTHLPGTLHRLLRSRIFVFSGLTLVAVPAAYAFYLQSSVPAQAAITVSSSSTSKPDFSQQPEVKNEKATTNDSGSSVKVTVNGQDIPVPDGGTLDTTIPTGNGSTAVHVDTDASGGGSNNSSSSLNVNINSHASSSGDGSERSTSNIRIRSSSR